MQRKILPLILLILSVSLNAQNSRASDLGNELIRASANGDLERVKYLVINTSVDINYIYIVLSEEFRSYQQEYIEIEGVDHSSTALSCAVEIGNLEMVKFLVNNGANINLLTGEDYSALNYATKKGNLDIVKFLVSKGANINPDSGCPPLISALEEEYPRAEHFEIVKFLISNRANVNVFYGDNNKNELDINRVEGLLLLLLTSETTKTHADILSEGSTPLTLAVRGGNLQIVKFLVDNKADINTVGYGGKTPISIAKERGWRDIVSYLRTKGASE